MPTEVEAKLAVDDHDSIRDRLRSLDAKLLGRVLETNTLYDDEEKTLLASDSGLRIRQNNVLDGEAKPDTLTYKGPRKPSAMKSRDEVEVVIQDAEVADELLGVLGYAPVLSFQKRRETWTLRDCRVELDEVPHLGRFIEVEGPNTEAIESALEALELADREILTDSYIALLIDYCRRHGLPTDDISFED